MTRAIAFIPARGGSKRVPNKNLREVGGVSLVRRACMAAYAANVHPVVSTDSVEIGEHVAYWPDIFPGASVHMRPPQLAGDHAMVEDAIAHWWQTLAEKPDVLVLLQPTSPFRTAAHVREALRLLEVTGADSVIGVTVSHESHFAGRLKPREVIQFATPKPMPDGVWALPPFDTAAGDTHARWFDWSPFRDPAEQRPRTQDVDQMGHENGAVFAVTRSYWERTGRIVGGPGHAVALPMSKIEGLDIDTEEDIAIANALAAAGLCA